MVGFVVQLRLRSESPALLASGATFQQKSRKASAMSAAVTKSRSRSAAARPDSPAISFLVFEDNGGDYCWSIVGGDGESLAQSRPYATHDDAASAASVVRNGAGSEGS